MAQPPAAVARSLKPVGQLRLHHLVKRARFRCVHCQRDNTDSVVATMNGNWAQMVCGGCYGLLVHEYVEKAKWAAERKELKRRLPGIDGLLAFFRAAGVDAALQRGGRLRINGHQTPPLTHLPPPKTLEWKTIVDEMALEYVSDRFVKAVTANAHFGKGLRGFLGRPERGFVILRDGVRVALLCPTCAQIPHREVIYANFLMPGPHWRQVANVLRGAEAELVAEWKREQEAKAAAEAGAAAAKVNRTRAPQRHIDRLPDHRATHKRAAAQLRIDQLPHDLPQELIAACLDASRRIRMERQVAYDRPVVLECNVGELTLLPIAGAVTRLRMPFYLRQGDGNAEGGAPTRRRRPPADDGRRRCR